MKKLILYVFIAFITFSHNVFAQDKFRLHYNVGFGLTRIQINVTDDVGDGSTTIIGNNIVPISPKFRNFSTKGSLFTPFLTAGFNLPFYKNNNWSLGVNLNAGISSWISVSNSEGLDSPFNLDFPEYLYYRNFKNKVDYSVMIGYRYTYSILPTHHILGALEVRLYRDTYLRLYSTLNRYKYYAYYSNGESKPLMGFSEYGLTLELPLF